MKLIVTAPRDDLDNWALMRINDLVESIVSRRYLIKSEKIIIKLHFSNQNVIP